MSVLNSCKICGVVHNITLNLHQTTVITDGEEVTLSEAFVYVLNLNIYERDDQTTGICAHCSSRLLDAFRLKRQAEHTHQMVQEKPNCLRLVKCGVKDHWVLHGEVEQAEDTEHALIHSICRADNAKQMTQEQHVCNENTKVDDGCSYVDVEELEMDNAFENEFSSQAENGVQFLSKKQLEDNDNVNRWKIEQNSNMKSKRPLCQVHMCQVCSRIFTRKSNLVDHLRLHAKVKLFQCKDCDKAFVQIANYRTHIRTHTNERPYKCSICPKTYTQSSALKIHIRSHTDERNYRCPDCFKAFTNSSDLNKHKRTHDPSKQFKCTNCHRLFSQKVNMLTHRRRVHS